MPSSPQEICNLILHTAYMGTSNSSKETRTRAQKMASIIGCYHVNIGIDSIIDSILQVFVSISGKTPQYKVNGGSSCENLALQNIQARSRIVVAYLFAQLLLWSRNRPGSPSLLVLGSSNVDETLRGYLTKYDCSSADLNPIGGISKIDLRTFIENWAATSDKFSFLEEFLDAPPTAELEPISDSYVQTDEVDLLFF
jgi:NAD+ synthase (glutamine-hydrolysing)